jgi:hypothetical protein
MRLPTRCDSRMGTLEACLPRQVLRHVFMLFTSKRCRLVRLANMTRGDATLTSNVERESKTYSVVTTSNQG